MIKYSILIPVYNVEKYVAECFDSVINQDFPRSQYEIVVTDDGSTDNSSAICDKYALEYSNFRVFHQNNQGLMMARKKGVLEAKGDYLLFIDSDDYVDSNMLSVIDDIIAVEQPDFLMHGNYNTYVNNETEAKVTKKSLERLNKKEFIKRFAYQTNLNSIGCKVVRRELLRDHVEEIYKNINISEDMLQTAYLTKYSDKIILIDTMLYHYRIVSGSVIHRVTLDTIYETLHSYEMVREVIDSILYSEPEWEDDFKEEVQGIFDAKTLNGIMENIYRYNITENIRDEYRLKSVINGSVVRDVDYKYIKKAFPIYNKIRWKLYSNNHYDELVKIDIILRKIQLIKEKISGTQRY